MNQMALFGKSWELPREKSWAELIKHYRHKIEPIEHTASKDEKEGWYRRCECWVLSHHPSIIQCILDSRKLDSEAEVMASFEQALAASGFSCETISRGRRKETAQPMMARSGPFR